MTCGVANTAVQASAKAVVKSGMNKEIWLRCVSQRVRMGSAHHLPIGLLTFAARPRVCVMMSINVHYKARHNKHTQRHHTDALARDGALS